MHVRLNVGCGQAPSAGWLNYDNSPAVWLAKSPLLARLLRSAGVIDAASFEFAAFCRANQIRYANAARRIPHAPGTVDVIYSSHMIEHLVRDDAWSFLLECHRVLRPGGRLRLVVPDLHALVHEYLQRGNADFFVGQMQFETRLPPGALAKLKWLIFGGRTHHWMYDARSLGGLMEEAGFADVEMMEPGRTRIVDPDGLDLRERYIESIYLEGRRPWALTQS
jgi:predicted SAM-dependent methyltransferase